MRCSAKPARIAACGAAVTKDTTTTVTATTATGRAVPSGWLFHELEVTPSQRSSLESAFRGFKDEARGIKSALFGGRHDLAEALRGEDLDVDLLGSTLAGGDETLDRARRAVANLTAEVHKILDPEQRERLADILERRGHSRFGWA